MTENYNINAHYTNNPKVAIRKPMIATSPVQIPNRHIYNDEEAKKRLKAIDNDIKKDYEAEKNKEKRRYFRFVSLTALVLLAFLSLKKFFKKS